MIHREGRSFRTLRRVVRMSGPRAVIPFLVAFAVLLIVTWQLTLLDSGPDERVTVSASYTHDADGYLLDVRVSPVLIERILASVSDGNRAQISFVARRYARSDQYFGLLGNTLVSEILVTRTLSFDPYTEEYRIRDSRGHDEWYETVVNAVRELYRAESIRVPDHEGASSPADLRIRAVINPMVLANPLFLVEPLLADRRLTGAWVNARKTVRDGRS